MISLFLGSFLAHLEPKFQLFEVDDHGDAGNDDFFAPSSSKLQTVVTWVLEELERNPKKENHLITISSVHRLEIGSRHRSVANWPTRMSGYVQGNDNGGDGVEDGGQDEGDHQAGGREDLVHPRGLGARRAEDQERGEGQGRDGLVCWAPNKRVKKEAAK